MYPSAEEATLSYAFAVNYLDFLKGKKVNYKSRERYREKEIANKKVG